MNQSTQFNSARDKSKEKKKITSFNWCIGLHSQRTKILLKWCGMNLTEKSELNNPQFWLTADKSCKKDGSTYIFFTSFFDRKNADNQLRDSDQKG